MPEQNPVPALEADEQQLLDAFEHGALTSVATPALLMTSANPPGLQGRRISASISACPVVISRPSEPGHCRRGSLIRP